MILSNTKKIGLGATCWLFVLGPLIGVTYMLYALVYWMRERGLPKAVIMFPVGLIFAAVNVAHNWIVCTILFRELRDITDNPKFPWLEDADWPVKPE
jgi:hypothetical protein